MSAALAKAVAFAREELAKPNATLHRPRKVIDMLIEQHGGVRSYPSYRTAFRCCGISTSAAAWCDLVVHQMLLESWLKQASSA